jgi:hypothetical protein
MQDTLEVAPRTRGSSTVSLTIFYHENNRANFRKQSLGSRTNFRRRPLPKV